MVLALVQSYSFRAHLIAFGQCKNDSVLVERTELTMSKVMTAAMVLAVALAAGTAFAQDAARDKAGIIPGVAHGVTPLAPESRSTPMQAPVGHRQPRLSDLPSAPRPDDDQAAAPPRDDIDDRLRICRGC
jgi:hypothetical protein